jgi:hypothetical protein
VSIEVDHGPQSVKGYLDLCAAFFDQLHRERALEAAERRGETLGVLRYRRQQMLQNRERMIVVVKEHCGLLLLL